jgi:hypothetical protein
MDFRRADENPQRNSHRQPVVTNHLRRRGRILIDYSRPFTSTRASSLPPTTPPRKSKGSTSCSALAARLLVRRSKRLRIFNRSGRCHGLCSQSARDSLSRFPEESGKMHLLRNVRGPQGSPYDCFQRGLGASGFGLDFILGCC